MFTILVEINQHNNKNVTKNLQKLFLKTHVFWAEKF